ncbi:MAG: pseudouridine synthase [Actinomycetota bacterium]|nr:pseudouridine synthase [Actinomycetota bacterium]
MPEPEPETEGERLQKIISQAGIASRRVAEEMILEGRVAVNGAVAKLGDRARIGTDLVEVDGVPVMIDPRRVYWLLHKPVGVVSTTKDTHGRPVVTDLVPAEPHVYPVGRLDADSEGLIILTNDGDFAMRLTHPRFKVDKEYLVSLDRPVGRDTLSKLARGVVLDDGPTAPATLTQLSPTLVRMVIREGRNRQIRRMFELFSFQVVRLVRTRIGPVSDQRLGAGRYRALTQAELRTLWSAAREAG